MRQIAIFLRYVVRRVPETLALLTPDRGDRIAWIVALFIPVVERLRSFAEAMIFSIASDWVSSVAGTIIAGAAMMLACAVSVVDAERQRHGVAKRALLRDK